MSISISGTREYNILKRRITQIEKHFDFKQPLTGATMKQQDMLRGLRLLCHAEFEDYLESIANKVLEKAKVKWQLKRNANYNLASLLIWHEKISTSDSSITKSLKIITDYEKDVIKQNNGIKEDNIKKLFEPLGYKIDDFDSIFIATLSSFGSLRGEVAHTSAKKTTSSLDKHTELSNIHTLLNGMVEFENVIKSKL